MKGKTWEWEIDIISTNKVLDFRGKIHYTQNINFINKSWQTHDSKNKHRIRL